VSFGPSLGHGSSVKGNPRLSGAAAPAYRRLAITASGHQLGVSEVFRSSLQVKGVFLSGHSNWLKNLEWIRRAQGDLSQESLKAMTKD